MEKFKEYQIGELIQFKSHRQNYYLIVREDLGNAVKGRIRADKQEDHHVHGILVRVDKKQIL